VRRIAGVCAASAPGHLQDALLLGDSGLCRYGTYDITNLAT